MEPRSSLKSRSIVLADDHKILRAGLKKLILEDRSLKVTGEAGSGLELLSVLENHPCDLLILDISMPELDGLHAIDRITEKYPELRILILTMHNNPEYFREALAKKVDGYILKEDVYETLTDAVHTILGGGTYFSREMTRELPKTAAPADGTLQALTKREIEILHLVATGDTSRGIARRLNISERTVETHRSHIMDKLKVRNVAELVKFAVSRGMGLTGR